MRKIIVLSMISLDGVLQAPGGPTEDTSGGFAFGGWCALHSDALYSKIVKEETKPTAYLLGRKTFEIWEAYWPRHKEMWPGINDGEKYIFSTTRATTTWAHSNFIQTVADIHALKNSEGPDLQVWGSSELIQLLFEHDLVDEMCLKIHPILLGQGKKLFGNGVIPAAFKLLSHQVNTKGVYFAHYKRSGTVQVGNAGPA